MEKRVLLLSKKMPFTTDAVSSTRSAISKSISDKKYRKQAHLRFKVPVEQNLYQDANDRLLGFEKWLRALNDSAADSRGPGGDPRDRWLNVPLVLSIWNKPQPNFI